VFTSISPLGAWMARRAIRQRASGHSLRRAGAIFNGWDFAREPMGSAIGGTNCAMVE